MKSAKTYEGRALDKYLYLVFLFLVVMFVLLAANHARAQISEPIGELKWYVSYGDGFSYTDVYQDTAGNFFETSTTKEEYEKYQEPITKDNAIYKEPFINLNDHASSTPVK